MKKILIAAFAAVISLLPVSACGSDSNAGQENKEYPVIKFENDQRKFDFGNTPRGQEISHVFKFRNTGKAPLVIKDVASSCGTYHARQDGRNKNDVQRRGIRPVHKIGNTDTQHPRRTGNPVHHRKTH